MSAGRSADSPPSRPSEPVCASSAIARRSVGVVVDDLHRARRRARTTAARAPGSRSSSATATASSASVAMPPSGCGMPSRSHSALNCSRSSAGRSTPGVVPSIGMPPRSRHVRELQRRLAAEARRSRPRDRSPRFLQPRRRRSSTSSFGERLEEQAVAGVVVGGDRLGVAVDHHGLVAGVARARTRRARSSSRTRRPGRCGSGRCRGSRPRASSSGAISSSSS